jgi:hypothetical protein
MSKPTKREIIILVVMACAVLYGVYALFFASSVEKMAVKKETNINFNAVGNVKSDSLVKINSYILSRAEADWGKNPFLEKRSYNEYLASVGGTGQKNVDVKFIYNGYVDAGRMKMAIINGLEYSRGEKLDSAGYYLKEIYSSKVVIGNGNTGVDLVVPMEE